MPDVIGHGSRLETGGQSGFTLLETLVALVVLGFLVAGLAQGLRAGVAIWRVQQRQLASRGDLDAAEGTLRALIGRMDAGGPSGGDPGFAGTSRRLAFTTTLPPVAGELPTPQADVVFDVDASRQAQLLWRPHYGKPTQPAPPPARVPLLQDVDHLDIAYWEPSTGWRAEWTAIALPKLIRIRVAFMPATRRYAPDIVIRPMRDRWRQ